MGQKFHHSRCVLQIGSGRKPVVKAAAAVVVLLSSQDELNLRPVPTKKNPKTMIHKEIIMTKHSYVVMQHLQCKQNF